MTSICVQEHGTHKTPPLAGKHQVSVICPQSHEHKVVARLSGSRLKGKHYGAKKKDKKRPPREPKPPWHQRCWTCRGTRRNRHFHRQRGLVARNSVQVVLGTVCSGSFLELLVGREEVLQIAIRLWPHRVGSSCVNKPCRCPSHIDRRHVAPTRCAKVRRMLSFGPGGRGQMDQYGWMASC